MSKTGMARKKEDGKKFGKKKKGRTVKIRNKIHKILFKISPVYRMFNRIQGKSDDIMRILLSSPPCYDGDEKFLHDDVPMMKINGIEYLAEIGNKKGMRVLEIGSRVVTGANYRNLFSEAEYVGFDYYHGENVDVAGDAHKLSTYFDKNEKFDIIFSAAVFEHFAMPWLVAGEMAKVLKPGGYVYVGTTFTFSSHDRPWHFFQFSDMALRVLFSPALGFECIEAGLSDPIVGRFSSLANEKERNRPVTGLYFGSHYLGKKIRDVDDFSWDRTGMDQVVGETEYPKLKK